jgi:hypothetical protein
MPRARRVLPFVLLLALVLSGCAVTFQPGEPVDTIRPRPPTDTARPDPSRPEPERPRPSTALPGDGSILQFEVAPNTIRPSSTMIFRTRFARAGYLTVSALSPEGRVEVLLHNYSVAPGFQLVPPSDAPAPERVRASGPPGTWVVRAQFSEARTQARYQGVRGYDAWTDAIADDLRGAPNASVYETTYEVQAR